MIHPTEGRIIINKIELKDVQLDGGLYVAGQALTEESLYYGEVISDKSEKFKKGTKVYYSRYSATKVYNVEAKETYYIVSEVDIMAYETN